VIDDGNSVIAADLAHICAALRDELTEMSGRRLLIVGGAGFLGHYLVQAALYWNRVTELDPIEVTVYDNYVRGMPKWLARLEGDRYLTLTRVDITEPLPTGMEHFDYVIHAASIASPTYYRMYPIETMDANVNGLRHLLEYALEEQHSGRPLTALLFCSTSEIYGDPSPEFIPTSETYRGNVSCTGPRACYDESKRYGETLCVNFARSHGLPIKVARPFNNYGPGLKITDRRVIADFARDILQQRDVMLLSAGTPTRTFCYIADATVGYYKVLVKGRVGEAYNIGAEAPEISMAALAELMVDLARKRTGYSGRVVRGSTEDCDYLVDSPNRRCPLITKARTELGYEPTITIQDGLTRSLLWYLDNREAQDS
jgi:dTDP-glucose 4,6-dehydratase/UDP-glucuronate decarboxylase